MKFFISVLILLQVVGAESSCSCEVSGNRYTPLPSSGCQKYTQYTEVTGKTTNLSCPGALVFDMNVCVCNWPSVVSCPAADQCDSDDGIKGATLLPYGADHGDALHPRADDRCGISFDVTDVVPAGSNINSVHICTNGIISLNIPYVHNMPQTFPLSPNHPSVIAPFWADIDLTFSGNLWARQGKLADIRGVTETAVEGSDEWAILATWENVEAFETNRHFNSTLPTNTFQCLLHGDSSSVQMDFLYSDLQWPSTSHPGPAQMGYDIKYGNEYYALSESGSTSISDVLMQGKQGPGVWSYRFTYPN